MGSEFEGVLKEEKQIQSRSPWIHGLVGIGFLAIGIVLLLVYMASRTQSRVAGLCGACFAIAAIAFSTFLAARQAKFNLQVTKTINELMARPKG